MKEDIKPEMKEQERKIRGKWSYLQGTFIDPFMTDLFGC